MSARTPLPAQGTRRSAVDRRPAIRRLPTLILSGAAGLAALAAAQPALAQATAPYPPPGYAAAWQPEGEPNGPNDYYAAPAMDGDALAARAGGRHTGFQLRVSMGSNLVQASARHREGETTLGGFSGGLSVAAGGALIEDLVLFGEVGAASAIAPRVRGPGAEDYPHGTVLTSVALGGGLAYHLTSSEVWFGAALLLTQLRAVDRPNDRLLRSTQLGPALHVQAGKDWPLTERWALGLALRGHLAELDDSSPRQGPWQTYGLGLALSALYD